VSEQDKENKENKGYKVVDKRSQQAEPVPEQEKQATAQNQQEVGGQEKEKEPAPPEELTFIHIVLSLGTSAYIDMDKEKNLPRAKQTIDALGILQEKTKGNLTREEEDLLKKFLFDLRVRYINETKK